MVTLLCLKKKYVRIIAPSIVMLKTIKMIEKKTLHFDHLGKFEVQERQTL